MKETKVYKVHDCNEMEDEAIITVIKYNGVKDWHLLIEDYGDRTRIKFCPYCGIELPKVEDNIHE